MYQLRKTVFGHISKHLEVHLKYPARRHVINSFLSVRKCGQARSFVFDKLAIAPTSTSVLCVPLLLLLSGLSLKIGLDISALSEPKG